MTIQGRTNFNLYFYKFVQSTRLYTRQTPLTKREPGVSGSSSSGSSNAVLTDKFISLNSLTSSIVSWGIIVTPSYYTDREYNEVFPEMRAFLQFIKSFKCSELVNHRVGMGKAIYHMLS